MIPLFDAATNCKSRGGGGGADIAVTGSCYAASTPQKPLPYLHPPCPPPPSPLPPTTASCCFSHAGDNGRRNMGKELKKGDKILSLDEKCVRGNWKKEACLGSKVGNGNGKGGDGRQKQ